MASRAWSGSAATPAHLVDPGACDMALAFFFQRNFEQSKRRPVWIVLFEHPERDVIDRGSFSGFSFRLPSMRMAVKGHGYAVPIQRFLQTAGSEKRHDLRRLALHGGSHRLIMQQRDQPGGSQACQRRFELERFTNGLLDKVFNRLLAPRLEGVAAEPSGESFYSGEADTEIFASRAVQDDDSCIGQDFFHLFLFGRFEFVIAQYRDDGKLQDRQFLYEYFGFFRQS